MKRKFVTAIFLAVSALVGKAQAQNTVTLYGRITAGLDYVTNQGTASGSANVFRFGDNRFAGSWWGLTGDEDLGGGTHAVFKLESMFSPATGQFAEQSEFDRYAYVGLQNQTFGSLWLGRSMSLTDTLGYYIDPFGEQSIGIGSFAKGRAWGSRANTATYNSPEWAGFSFRVQNGFGNDASGFQHNRQFSVSSTYNLGNLSAYGVYEEIRDANGKFSSLYSASREYMAGATYSLQAFKFFAGYQQLVASGQDIVANDTNPYGATRNQQEWVGLTYQMTPALQFQAAYFHANVNHGGGVGNLGVLGASYALSKRTLLEATVGAMFNGGKAAFALEAGDIAPLQGHNQQGGYVGIVHTF
ncbi:porin [Caballeronia sp. NCTM5]|uniref:porin n=1 Tax=Caballeronia sp. NCTM5 TaxID=2921755 RepID=UPI0020286A7F|nr:porin [Caballeronia sp. NCTM5]